MAFRLLYVGGTPPISARLQAHIAGVPIHAIAWQHHVFS